MLRQAFPYKYQVIQALFNLKSWKLNQALSFSPLCIFQFLIRVAIDLSNRISSVSIFVLDGQIQNDFDWKYISTSSTD